jgi:hypothetical protein
MRLQMRGTDHDPLYFWSLPCKGRENTIEYASACPVDEAIIVIFVGDISVLCVFLLQVIADGIKDFADNAPVAYVWNTVREWKGRRNARDLLFTQKTHRLWKPALILRSFGIMNQPKINWSRD